MDIILLAITIVSLVVALVMSMAAWRLTRDEKQRSAARVAALSLAAGTDDARQEQAAVRAPWARSSFDSAAAAAAAPAPLRMPPPIIPAAELPLNQPFDSAASAHAKSASLRMPLPIVPAAQAISHASGFLGATETTHNTGSPQRGLAIAAIALFVVLSGGLVWMMSGPRGTTAVAVGPNSPLELVSLSHARQDDKLAVSGLVRNPVSGKPVEKLSAVVFLFDRTGTFVTSSKANVDFLKLSAGDESPFVVSIAAPATVARYRVSFRTDEGIIPHIDRRGESPAEAVGIQQSAVKSSVSSQQ